MTLNPGGICHSESPAMVTMVSDVETALVEFPQATASRTRITVAVARYRSPLDPMGTGAKTIFMTMTYARRCVCSTTQILQNDVGGIVSGRARHLAAGVATCAAHVESLDGCPVVGPTRQRPA